MKVHKPHPAISAAYRKRKERGHNCNVKLPGKLKVVTGTEIKVTFTL